MARRNTRQTCRHCERHRDEVGGMSATGLCPECGERLMRENATAISTHRGPEFDRWRKAVAASVGAVLPARDSETETV